MCYLRFHVIHLAPATRWLILHPAEHVWQQMVQGSLLSYLLSNSLCPVQPLTLQHDSRCTCRHPSHTHKRTERHLRGGWGVVSHFIHSLPALLGVLQGAARRLTEPAVMQLFWAYCGWGLGGGGFQWHQLLTPAERPLCHKEIMINTSLSFSLHRLIWSGAVFFFIYF